MVTISTQCRITNSIWLVRWKSLLAHDRHYRQLVPGRLLSHTLSSTDTLGPWCTRDLIGDIRKKTARLYRRSCGMLWLPFTLPFVILP